jgi:hypothetical protein
MTTGVAVGVRRLGAVGLSFGHLYGALTGARVGGKVTLFTRPSGHEPVPP